MITSNIKATIHCDIHKVWETVLSVDKYGAWRSDLSRTKIINEKKFMEYTKEGYATTFTVTLVEPYQRWEFDMDRRAPAVHFLAHSDLSAGSGASSALVGHHRPHRHCSFGSSFVMSFYNGQRSGHGSRQPPSNAEDHTNSVTLDCSSAEERQKLDGALIR